jgi:hypothetical protein
MLLWGQGFKEVLLVLMVVPLLVTKGILATFFRAG